MFNMKKLWKKMCVLGVSAVTALSFSLPFVKASPPASNTLGQQFGTANILLDEGTPRLIPFATIKLEGSPKAPSTNTGDGTEDNYARTTLGNFSGHPKAVINSVVSVQVTIPQEGDTPAETINLDWEDTDNPDPNTKVNLYLRVRNVIDKLGTVDSSSGTWVHINSQNKLSDASLTRRYPGNYVVYYYIDHLNTPYGDTGSSL